jgi:hypothetical protein
MWKSIVLIALLHGSATFDAWTTNRLMGNYPARELNPIYRPFAGKPTMYVALNVAMVPLDIWLLSGKKKKLARIVAGATVGFEAGCGIRNMHVYNEWRRFYDRWWAEREAARLPKPMIVTGLQAD